jgi:hypothetical protein
MGKAPFPSPLPSSLGPPISLPSSRPPISLPSSRPPITPPFEFGPSHQPSLQVWALPSPLPSSLGPPISPPFKFGPSHQPSLHSHLPSHLPSHLHTYLVELLGVGRASEAGAAGARWPLVIGVAVQHPSGRGGGRVWWGFRAIFRVAPPILGHRIFAFLSSTYGS